MDWGGERPGKASYVGETAIIIKARERGGLLRDRARTHPQGADVLQTVSNWKQQVLVTTWMWGVRERMRQ